MMMNSVEDVFAASTVKHEYRKRQHSDCSDDDGASSPKSSSPSIDDDRRAHHNELERRRRDHIKDHFLILKDAIPLLEGEKSSRALILKRAVEYISAMQSRINENQRNMEELRRKNELLEEKLKEREPSTSPLNITTLPQISISPIALPVNIPVSVPIQVPTTVLPQSPVALSTMNPTDLNNLIASSQEAIIALTQSLLGKMNTEPTPSVYPYERQMTVRF
ncbi:unnamed protein product [Caenorhabditis angaria]|uniref:BHLH domain-containing protein n=1 Tax=Caenorhabditis angaria TaxID=860376 RepID=A0A9P1J2H9_9PELO|nr:unnamed protein product [Caenorhabditis angaria]